MSERPVHLFAAAADLRLLAACGLPDLLRQPESALAERVPWVGLPLESLLASPDRAPIGWPRDPLLEPVSAPHRPLRVLLQRLEPESPAATDPWSTLTVARQAAGQRDAQAALDVRILVRLPSPWTHEDQVAAADQARTQAVFVLGPVHRAGIDRQAARATDSWAVECARLLAALAASPDLWGVRRPGLWAWNSVAVELSLNGRLGDLRREVAALTRQRLLPEAVPWQRERAQDGAVTAPPAALLPTTPVYSEEFPSDFSAWPPEAVVPLAVSHRARLDAPPWRDALFAQGREHREGRDAADLAAVHASALAEGASVFAEIRQQGPAQLRAVAGSAVRSGVAGQAGQALATAHQGWQELARQVTAARAEAAKVEACAVELGRARRHFPPFLWRLLVAGASSLFVGSTLALAAALLPTAGPSTALLTCLSAAAGAAAAAGWIWRGERRSGQAARAHLQALTQEQELRRKNAAQAAGRCVDNGLTWWRNWRLEGAARAIRLAATRLERNLNVAVQHHCALLESPPIPHPMRAYQEAATIPLPAARLTNPPPAPAPPGPPPDQLHAYRALSEPDAERGAVHLHPWRAELDARLRAFIDHEYTRRRRELEVTTAEANAAWRAVCQRLSGLEETDFPGLSVITEPNPGRPTHTETLLARASSPLLDPAPGTFPAWMAHTAHGMLPPGAPWELLLVRLVPVHPDTTAGRWQEGTPTTEAPHGRA